MSYIYPVLIATQLTYKTTGSCLIVKATVNQLEFKNMAPLRVMVCTQKRLIQRWMQMIKHSQAVITRIFPADFFPFQNGNTVCQPGSPPLRRQSGDTAPLWIPSGTWYMMWYPRVACCGNLTQESWSSMCEENLQHTWDKFVQFDRYWWCDLLLERHKPKFMWAMLPCVRQAFARNIRWNTPFVRITAKAT